MKDDILFPDRFVQLAVAADVAHRSLTDTSTAVAPRR
jgi:hypothetical protein